MNKAVISIIVIGGAVTGAILLSRRAEAAPLEEFIPVTSDIMGSESVAELNAYYNYIGELRLKELITHEEYMTLYNAYYDRWYELTGVS